MPIDWLCDATGIFPNYIKIDVDGNELQVLKGALDTLKRSDCYSVYIELWDGHQDYKSARQLLENAGFTCKAIGESTLFMHQDRYTMNYVFEKSPETEMPNSE